MVPCVQYFQTFYLYILRCVFNVTITNNGLNSTFAICDHPVCNLYVTPTHGATSLTETNPFKSGVIRQLQGFPILR